MKNTIKTLILIGLLSTWVSLSASAHIVQLWYHGSPCYATGLCANIKCPPGWSCVQYTGTLQNKGALQKTIAGGATLTTASGTGKVASPSLVKALDALAQKAMSGKLSKEQLQQEEDKLWNSPDSWKVSDAELDKIAKELHTTVMPPAAGTK